MTWIKICGMTNVEDALVAAEAGADAVGFVFYEKSPRNISAEAAREIAAKLPANVEKIGVFVNGCEPNPLDTLLDAGLTGTQTYFLEDSSDRRVGGPKGIDVSLLPKRARFLMALPMRLFSAEEQEAQKPAAHFATWGKNRPQDLPLGEGMLDTFVLDSGDLRRPGGTGKAFDWKKAVPIAEEMRRSGVKLVVAGGLTPENVGEAMRILKPWGVDVSSGVEFRPGKKDPEKVRAFVRAVREMDAKVSQT